MKHLEHTQRLSAGNRRNEKTLFKRASGKFYTPIWMAQLLAKRLLENSVPKGKVLRIVDPFCGDGRLLVAVVEQIAMCATLRGAEWHFELWDKDEESIAQAKVALCEAVRSANLKATVHARLWDTLLDSTGRFTEFNFVVTNPPWEVLKPDSRELRELSNGNSRKFVYEMRAYDKVLAEHLPYSQPTKKVYGWGTNLSRCGLEIAVKLLAPHGVCGIVLPSSILADQVSVALRKWLLQQSEIIAIDYFPAEAKPFDQVDQPSIVMTLRREVEPSAFRPRVSRYCRNREVIKSEQLILTADELEGLEFRVPAELSSDEIALLRKLSQRLPLFNFGVSRGGTLWMGRELDETSYRSFLSSEGDVAFLKGRAINRFSSVGPLKEFVRRGAREIPASAHFHRVAWRDVSRRSQARRMLATIIPPGVVTGNSLHVAYFVDDDQTRLLALLGVLNSLAFEFQLRSALGTGHVSLGSVRGLRVPDLHNTSFVRTLAPLVQRVLAGESAAEIEIEVVMAEAYSLSQPERRALVNHFSGLTPGFSDMLQNALKTSVPGKGQRRGVTLNNQNIIPNHYTARLSALDLEAAICVPPGGNWKNIPKTVPSKRLDSIRVSYAAGGGSRSTYYGRLHPDRPSYTINTYFNRPGNGCHLHYDYEGGQHRVLSEREAARLQSFPDDFVFIGSHVSIQKQIGNAVPPLLAYEIATALPFVGQYVDLFSGAGGLSLGFKWAGWEPLVGNDIEDSFLATYRRNVHPTAVCGDIRQAAVFEEILHKARKGRRARMPLLVLGGPPCQGFSTAGKRRTLDDDRNNLFNEFKRLVQELKPEGFVFENVTGLLNMENGRVLETIKAELEIPGNRLCPWILKAEQYGVPQRRTRLILVSTPNNWPELVRPIAITSLYSDQQLFGNISRAVSVSEALSDLPALLPGEDGSGKDYTSPPRNPYQRLMRGIISPNAYLCSLAKLVEVEG